MPNPIEAYGVFEGGGVKGTALVGALKAAEERGIVFKAVAGTSAGAIVASLVAAGYTADELNAILTEKDFRDFMDPIPRSSVDLFESLEFVKGVKFARGVAKIWKSMGFYKGDHFHDWIRELLSRKIFGVPNKSPQFRDLPRPLTVVATELTFQEIRFFDRETSQNVRVADAVRMSMSIPYFFVPFRLGDEFYVDGGVMSNFPAWVFRNELTPQSPPILGFRIGEDGGRREIRNVIDLALALVETVGKEGIRFSNEGIPNLYSVRLPTLDVGTTDFDISKKKKLELYEAGLRVTQDYLKEKLL